MLEGINVLVDIFGNFVTAIFNMRLFGSVSFGSFIIACAVFSIVITLLIRKVL